MIGRSLAMLGLGAGLVGGVGCDGDTTPPNSFDAGSDATLDGSSEAATDGSTDAGVTRAKIIAIHASPDVPAVRVCFGVGLQNDGSDAVIAPLAPLPSKVGSNQAFPGLFPGSGGALPDFGIDLSQKAISPYAIVASKIAQSTAACDALIKGGTLTQGVDYFALPVIKNGTLTANSTFALALMGCLPQAQDGTASTLTCGSDWTAGAGNVAIKSFALDRVVKDSQTFGVQFLYVASPAAGEFALTYGTSALNARLHPLADGGTDQPIAQAVTLGVLAPGTAAALTAPNVNGTSFVVEANVDGGAMAAFLLPLVYEATTGQATGATSYFVTPANYTFVLVGDPTQPTLLDGGSFNGYSLHTLAFPNDPTLPTP